MMGRGFSASAGCVLMRLHRSTDVHDVPCSVKSSAVLSKGDLGGDNGLRAPPLTFLVGGLVATLVTLVAELDKRVALELLVPLVTRELALVAADTVRARIGTTVEWLVLSERCSWGTPGRNLGAGGVLLLASSFDLGGVDVVVDTARLRGTRAGEGPGLKLVRPALDDLGLSSPADGDGEAALLVAIAALFVISAGILRLPSAVADGRRPARGLSPGLSFRCGHVRIGSSAFDAWADLHRHAYNALPVRADFYHLCRLVQRAQVQYEQPSVLCPGVQRCAFGRERKGCQVRVERERAE